MVLIGNNAIVILNYLTHYLTVFFHCFDFVCYTLRFYLTTLTILGRNKCKQIESKKKKQTFFQYKNFSVFLCNKTFGNCNIKDCLGGNQPCGTLFWGEIKYVVFIKYVCISSCFLR